jgi:hypothetical protein
MIPSRTRSRCWAVLLSGSLCLALFNAVFGVGADYGGVSGTVSDAHGNPLMGATVLVMGPTVLTGVSAASDVERVITDAHGKFQVEHLVPGWYSLRVTSPTRVPAMRDSIRVLAGQTADQKFILTDIFAPMRFQVPKTTVTTWGDDWKWVLRTSASTRPILRFQQEVAQASEKPLKAPLPASRKLIGLIPGSAHRDPLSDDAGMGSVLAYLRPLSQDSDLLVAGSMAPYGTQASTVATAVRRNLARGNPQELTLVVHQLSFSDGIPMPSGSPQDAASRAQGIMASYSQTRHLSTRLTITAGMELNYLNAIREALITQPQMKMEYQLDRATILAVQYGGGGNSSGGTLLERVGMLNAFPRITLRNYRLELEQLDHAETSLTRQLSKSSKVEIAAYHDGVKNAAVWGLGHPDGAQWPSGNFLPNPAGDGVTMNTGNYNSAGVRAAYSQALGSHVQALVAYTLGDALAVEDSLIRATPDNIRGALQTKRTDSVAGKVATRIPVTRTMLVTSYGWMPAGRVTVVDPYGLGNLDLPPYLGVQIRQPLPTIAFLPARIEAIADFRNLLAQGYVPVAQGGQRPILLSSSYRYFRGGFSVQF